MLDKEKSAVLAVDDQPGNLLAVEASLASLGVEVVQASSGAEALLRAREREFSVILLDLDMPGMDGIQAIRLLRQNPLSCNCPILLLAPADVDEADLVRGYEAGATDVIHHTTSPAILRAKVRNLAALSQRTSERLQAEEELAEANRSLLESQRFVKALTEATPQIIFVLDLNERRVAYINSAITSILGYRPRQVEDMGSAFFDRLVHPDDMATVLEHIGMMKQAKVGEQHEYEARFCHTDGSWRWMCTRSTVFARYPDGKPRQLAGSSYDITDIKLATEELRRLNEELEQRVKERTAALEESGRRSRLLSEASAVLAGSLDYQTTLDQTAHLAVPEFADWCVVHAVGDDGAIRGAVVAHSDPEYEALAWGILEMYPYSASAPSGVAEVIRTAKPVLIPDVGPELWMKIGRDAGHRELLEGLNLRSAISVPIIGRDRVLGAMSFATAESGRKYGPADLEFARELARRTAIAVENALLYRAAQDEVAERARAESARSEADQRLRDVVDNTTSAIEMKDLSGRYLLVNRQWEILTGISAQEALGKTPHDIYPDALAASLLDHDRKVVEAGEAVTFEEELPFADEKRAFLSTKFPLRDAAGGVYAVGGVATDITERKRMEEALRESEERLSAIFSQTLAGVAQTDLDGRFVHVNQRFCEIVGRPMDQVLRARMQDYSHPDDMAPDTRRLRRISEQGSGFVIEKRYVRPDGSTVWVHNSVSALTGPDGRPEYAVAVVQDVTDRKHAEEELLHLNRELAEARDSAVQANQAKTAFLANMSHELRTPLNAVIGYAEMIQEELVEIGQEEMSRDLEKIHLAGSHLLTVIGDILDLSKIEAGRMDLLPEEFQVEEVVREAVAMVSPLVEKHDNGIAVRCEGVVGSMIADRTRFRQILFNLLSNAAKFTERGTITVLCRRMDEEGGAMIRLQVSDTGAGIPSELFERLFCKFQQLDATPTRRHGGTGLGLAICKLLCDLMGGTISAESAPGVGSTFTVLLPADTRVMSLIGREPAPL